MTALLCRDRTHATPLATLITAAIATGFGSGIAFGIMLAKEFV